MSHWTAADIPSQVGRTAVVTGTGGLGYEDALALARAGCRVVVAGRNPEKGLQAVARIRAEFSQADIRFELLDLARISSIRAFADRMTEMGQLHLLINNAGVMVPPTLTETADGFELQFGTNYLGHFALTGLLLPLLRQSERARVVTVSSIAAPQGEIDFDNLNAEQSYHAMTAYSQSKLACLMFAFELQRRSDAHGWNLASIAAHPGVARTELLHNGPGRFSIHRMVRDLLPFLFQPVAQGALPTLFAATASEAEPAGYYGPNRLGETRGYPVAARIPPQALDEEVAARLWEVSEQLAGVQFRAQPLPLQACSKPRRIAG
ncbi:NAD(P)-dependent dehydrogenase (short-subunit alcohol dehydrogenase family) [Sphingobium sp. OAS761]|uniref:oxidoreductase n=1 Tax=Sphingobium sp. OAS761 TaxID=2817901 RepID=UPI00209CB5FF|nr:oxidoreductase [Sphingobium sp. OAS761]MCP1471858.1 NAD(P)-dependent dehydrogenase (short-subunit alcohol dehydrogenase family) [Sphingobium sp. OAS761]